jgi:hypothetical protein
VFFSISSFLFHRAQSIDFKYKNTLKGRDYGSRGRDYGYMGRDYGSRGRDYGYRKSLKR